MGQGKLEQFLVEYVRRANRAEEPILPALVAFVDFRLHLLAEVLAIVRSSTLRVAQDALAALIITFRLHWRGLPVVSVVRSVERRVSLENARGITRNHYSLVVQIEQLLTVSHVVDQLIPVGGSQTLHAVRCPCRVQLVPDGVIVEISLLQVHYPRFMIYD